MFLAIPVIAGVAFGMRVRAGREVRRRLADLALEDGAFGDQFPVEVTVTADGKGLGTDRGVVWFDEGLMGFSGSASSFVLAASDVWLQSVNDRSEPMRPQLPEGSLLLRNAPCTAYLVMRMPAGQEATFEARLSRFIAEDARPEGERYWPPLVPYDETSALPSGERAEAVGPSAR